LAFLMAREEGGYAVPNLVDGEFWLPSDFLSDEATPLPKNSGFDHGRLPYEWGLGSVGFQVDSPGESPPAGLSETDEEDDYIAGLAERLAYAMLDDDENCPQGVDVGVGVHDAMNWASSQQRAFGDNRNAKHQMSKSPQSTLSGGLGRSRCSPTEGSRLSSNVAGDDAWELFHMAADQVVRLNMLVPESSDRYKPPVKGFTVAPGGESQFQWSQSVTDFQNGSSAFSGFDSGHNASHHGQQRPWNPRPRTEDRKIPAHQNHQYPQAKQSIARQGRLQTIQTQQGQNRCGHAKPASRIYSACPPGQQIAGGSGMRAVFLGSNGPGRESGGTGVFLPRRMDNGHAVKQKPACSTVLLPARIVQALNLNVEDLRSKPCGLSETSLHRRVYARAVEHQKAVGGEMWPVHDQKLGFYPSCSEVQPQSADISLPHEWTY